MTQVSEICNLKDQLSESKNIVMFGPQCSGKTTLARELTDYSYISLCQSVRESTDNNLLRQAMSLIEHAEPWPIELGLQFVAGSIRKHLECGQRVLIDGYPRRLDEYNILVSWLQSQSLPEIDTFLEVTAQKETLLARYALRSSRDNENQRFFNLRYEQYKVFSEEVDRLGLRRIMYVTG